MYSTPDSTAAMTGKYSGVITQINKLAPECKSMHWERLALKISQLN